METLPPTLSSEPLLSYLGLHNSHHRDSSEPLLLTQLKCLYLYECRYAYACIHVYIVCMYICTCLHVSICLWTHMDLCVNPHVSSCMCTCIVYAPMCIYIQCKGELVYICTCVAHVGMHIWQMCTACVFMCPCVCLSVCVCANIYVYVWWCEKHWWWLVAYI